MKAVLKGLLICAVGMAMPLSTAPASAQMSPAQLKAQKDRSAREAAARAEAERQRAAAAAAVVQQNAARAEAERRERAGLPKLDDVIVFTRPANCELSPATLTLFQNLIIFRAADNIGQRGPSVNVPGFAKPLLPDFSRKADDYPAINEAALPISGMWHDLRISKIVSIIAEESSFWEYQIRFREPASTVRKKLNYMGFNVPEVGYPRTYADEGVSEGIGVVELDGGSALICGSSWYY